MQEQSSRQEIAVLEDLLKDLSEDISKDSLEDSHKTLLQKARELKEIERNYSEKATGNVYM